MRKRSDKKLPLGTAERVNATIEEAAEILRLGRSAIYREIALGRLTLLKSGRRSVIALADLREWPSRARAA